MFQGILSHEYEDNNESIINTTGRQMSDTIDFRSSHRSKYSYYFNTSDKFSGSDKNFRAFYHLETEIIMRVSSIHLGAKCSTFQISGL